MNSSADDIARELRGFLGLYRDLLAVVEAENQALRQSEGSPAFQGYAARKELLPRLENSLEQLRRHRAAWTRATPEERAQHPEVPALLRQCQDAIMKILVLDRENEQALLRRGLLPPQHLPSHNQQRPHFVADLYRRQGG